MDFGKIDFQETKGRKYGGGGGSGELVARTRRSSRVSLCYNEIQKGHRLRLSTVLPDVENVWGRVLTVVPLLKSSDRGVSWSGLLFQ